jgi:hypothetical protein
MKKQVLGCAKKEKPYPGITQARFFNKKNLNFAILG